jgi:integrase
VERGKKIRQILDEANGRISLADVLPEEGKHKITFMEAAERWLQRAQKRRKHPLKKNTVRLYRHYLQRWIYPVIGDVPLGQVKTYKAKEVIDRMHGQESSSSVMTDTFHIITQVVASIKDEHFEPMFNVKWNLEEIDIPDIKKKQKKAFNADQINKTVTAAPGQYRVMFALLAATGLREGEAAAIEIGADPETTTTLSKDCRLLHVNSIILQDGTKQDSPKTPAGRREVDIHIDMAAMLLEFIGNRTSGYLFCAKSGKPLQYGNIRKNVLDKILFGTERQIMKREGKGWIKAGAEKIPGVLEKKGGYGFHSFRRFRTTYLRTVAGTPDAYVKFWLGHGKKTITDEYTIVKQETEKRRELCEKAGLGFQLPKAGEVVEVISSEKEKTA